MTRRGFPRAGRYLVEFRCECGRPAGGIYLGGGSAPHVEAAVIYERFDDPAGEWEVVTWPASRPAGRYRHPLVVDDVEGFYATRCTRGHSLGVERHELEAALAGLRADPLRRRVVVLRRSAEVDDAVLRRAKRAHVRRLYADHPPAGPPPPVA